jgi:hypothetical protein
VTRVGRDSVTAGDIPIGGLDVVMGYGTGRFTWSAADWARFGAIPKARIDVLGTDPAGCGILDVETGDATPASAPGWVQARRAAHPGIGGRAVTIYTTRSMRAAVHAALTAAGYQQNVHYTWWIATLDGTKTLPDMGGVVAVQWKAATSPVGTGHYDESVIYDPAWHPSVPVGPSWQAEALALAVSAGKHAGAADAALAALARLLREHQ